MSDEIIRVYDPVYLRNLMHKRADEHRAGQRTGNISDGRRGALIGRINEALEYITKDEENTRDNRLLILGWIFGNDADKFQTLETSNVLDKSSWYAIDLWIGTSYNEIEAKYEPRSAWLFEMAEIFHRSRTCLDIQDGHNAEGEFISLSELIEETNPKDQRDYIDAEYDYLITTGMILGYVVTEVAE